MTDSARARAGSEAVDSMTEQWINEEETSYGGAYRVEVPGGAVFLVRADGTRQAAQMAVEELGYAVVDEAVERCHVWPAHDVVAPGLGEIEVYPRWRESCGDGEYPYEASYDGPSFRASLVGYSGDSEHEAVENLVAALVALGVAGSVRVVPEFEPEPVLLSEWRTREDAGSGVDEQGR